jgi:hypothetical protein
MDLHMMFTRTPFVTPTPAFLFSVFGGQIHGAPAS